MWQAISGAQWATIWAAISALFSLATVAVAIWAMFQWRAQERQKAKFEFKSAVSKFASALNVVPEEIVNAHVRERHKEQLQALENNINSCSHAWWVSEGIMDDIGNVKKAWGELFNLTWCYLRGEAKRQELALLCQAILQEKFVFK